MAYGKLKADTLIYDNSGSDVEVTISSLGDKAPLASPTFTGTVTIPTPAANDITTKAASTAYVQTEIADFITTSAVSTTYAPKADPTFTGTINGAALTLSGNLTVQGTTTTVSSTTLEVADKNLELGKVSSPSDTTADGGGITLKGATDKTFNWVDATDAWTSSEHIHVGDNKKVFLGTGSDFSIYHDGSGSYLQGNSSGTGNVYLDANGSKGIYIRSGDGASGVHQAVSCVNNAQVELYHDNTKKFETTAAGVTVSGSVTDDKGDVRSIPLNTQANAYTLVATDAGKTVLASGNITIADSVFSAGDAVTIINNTNGDLTINKGSTLYYTADGSSANRTLATRGMATIYFSHNTTGYISGSGLS